MSKKKKKNWIAIILTLVVIGFYYALAYLPSCAEAKQLQLETQQMRNYISSSMILPVSIHDTNAKLELTDNYLNRWRRRTPQESEIPQVFAEISRLARQAEVVTTRFDPDQPVRMQTLSKTPVSLTVTGNFHQIFSMLHKLDRFQRPLWIEQIQIERPGRDSESVECEIKLIVFATNSGHSD